jgi:cytochrome c peroxidase
LNKILSIVLTLILSPAVFASEPLLKIAVGKLIFNDKNLSQPSGQSCSSCHAQDSAFADLNQMVSPGANPALFGNRNAPSISYVKYNPDLYWDKSEQHWVGGFFYDGRAKTLSEQAGKPFTNPLEMGNPSNRALIDKVKKAQYAPLLEKLYGQYWWRDESEAMDAITGALASYERGPDFALFSSKYDLYLQGKVALSAIEKQGLEVFEAEDKGNCAACHPSQPGPKGEPPLFTDFTYDNLGLAVNPKLPFLNMVVAHNPKGKQYVDPGLANNGYIDNAQSQRGKFKVPTLRNIAKTGPYMHNGIFDKLEDAVAFYNSRDDEAQWGSPAIEQNVNHEELGDLKLSEEEIQSLLVFLQTLSDGYVD